MKSIFGLPRGVVLFLAAIIVFMAFNAWLMRQMEHVAGNDIQMVKHPAPAALPAGAHVPVIDRENDLLAPVTKAESPQIYLKRRLQKNTDQREYGLPKTGMILND